jgi:hypothetical protein
MRLLSGVSVLPAFEELVVDDHDVHHEGMGVASHLDPQSLGGIRVHGAGPPEGCRMELIAGDLYVDSSRPHRECK